MWSLEWPWVLLALPLPFVVRRLMPAVKAAADAGLKVPSLSGFRLLQERSELEQIMNWRFWLALTAWLMLVLAAARPQRIGDELDVPVSGRNLMLAVDLSGSMDAKDFDRSVAVNLTATGHLIPMVAPLLGPDATALFFEDNHSGEKFFSAYGATKAAQIAMPRSWAAEQNSASPQVHIAAPNPMPTATRARFYPGEDRAILADPKDEAARILGAINLGR